MATDTAQGGSHLELSQEAESKLGMRSGFETQKSAPSDGLPQAKSHLLDLPVPVPPTGDQVLKYMNIFI